MIWIAGTVPTYLIIDALDAPALKLVAQNDLHVPIPALFSYLLPVGPLVSHSNTVTTSNRHKPLSRASRTLFLLRRFSFPFMHLHLSCSFSITGTPKLLLRYTT